MAATKCLLESMEKLHEPLLLGDGQDFFIGRSRETKIKAKRCSKKQVKLQADYQNCRVLAFQIGSNAAGINGESLPKDGSGVDLKENDTLELLVGEFPYKVSFFPQRELKRKSSDSQNSNIFSPIKDPDIETNFLKNSSKMPKLCSNKDFWESFDDGNLLVFKNDNFQGSKKVAAYDMDGTLITTKSGLVFPKDTHDWKIIYSEVPGKLKQLQLEGFKIVIFTNQAGISKNRVSVVGMQSKIAHIIRKLGISAQVFVSTGRTKYRKPYPEMWNFFVTKHNDGIEVDDDESFYVGDAAGRPEIKKVKKKDHSCVDRLFAMNIGIQFFTPEEHFLGKSQQPFALPEFNPMSVFACPQLLEPSSTKVPAFPLEVILLVGYPGSGKTSFVQNHLFKHGYIHVNRDTAGSWQKCVTIMESSLKQGKNVVIDNTNPDKESRKRYISICNKLEIPIRCFWFQVSKVHAKHNNRFREIIEYEHSKVNEMVFNSYSSKFQEPSLTEGYVDLIKVNFMPIFKQKKFEEIYKLYLLEK